MTDLIEIGIYTERLANLSTVYYVHTRVTPRYVELFPSTTLNREFYTVPIDIKMNTFIMFIVYPIIRQFVCKSELVIDYKATLATFSKTKRIQENEKNAWKGFGHFSLCFLLNYLRANSVLTDSDVIHVQSYTKYDVAAEQLSLNNYYFSIGFKNPCNHGVDFFASLGELLNICINRPRPRFGKKKRRSKRRSKRKTKRIFRY